MIAVMSMTATDLPDDIEALKALLLSQQEAHQEKEKYLELELDHLREQLNLLLHKRFGASSEKQHSDQIELFDEDAALAESAPEAESDDIAVPSHTRRRGKRSPLPDILPRVEVIHDLPEDEKTCPHDGHALSRIGEECSEQLDVIPAKIHVIRHIRIKYACPCCDQGLKTAAMPAQPIPKSQASPGLLAHIAVSKYVDALPLYRQSEMWSRVKVNLDRTTLANWMVRVGELLTPIMNLMQDKLLAAPLVQCDETQVQVLKEPGKAPQSKSYMWVRTSGVPPNRITLFHYAPSRSAEVPRALLNGFSGTLLTDGYEGYTPVVQEQSLVHAGCWAHVRRKFDEALKSRKKSSLPKGGKASHAMNIIGKLYRVEHAAKDMTCDERLALRKEQALPILEGLRQWLDKLHILPHVDH